MNSQEKFRRYARSFVVTPDTEPDFFSYIRDIYDCPEWQSMDKYIQHADITRCRHILSVAYTSYLNAREVGVCIEDTVRGAMLHDLFYYDWHTAGDGSHRLHGYRHPGFALKNAKELFSLTKKQENIIVRHMWPLTPTPPRYREGFIVSFWDKYCSFQEILINKIPSYRQKFDKAVEEERKKSDPLC